jgi:hypothetical protein
VFARRKWLSVSYRNWLELPLHYPVWPRRKQLDESPRRVQDRKGLRQRSWEGSCQLCNYPEDCTDRKKGRTARLNYSPVPRGVTHPYPSNPKETKGFRYYATWQTHCNHSCVNRKEAQKVNESITADESHET